MIPHWHQPQPRASEHPEELIEPTEEERKNGWDAKSLTKYVNEQRAANAAALDWKARPRPRPQVQNGGLNFGGRMIRPSWRR